jgi:hypothetical protein
VTICDATDDDAAPVTPPVVFFPMIYEARPVVIAAVEESVAEMRFASFAAVNDMPLL